MSTSTPGRLELRSMARIVDQLPGRLGPMPEVLRAQPDVPGDIGPCYSACRVKQLSRATWARVRWPAPSTKTHERLVLGSVDSRFRPVFPGNSGSGRGPAGSTRSPGRLSIESECPRCQLALLGDSCSFLSARGFDLLTWVIGIGSDGPRGRPADRDLAPTSYSPLGRPALPGESGHCVSACDVDHPS